MNRSARKIAAAACTLSAALVIPMALATPAQAAGGDIPPPNVVKTVQDYYCGWDFTPYCW